MSRRDVPLGKAHSANNAENLTAMFDPIIQKILVPLLVINLCSLKLSYMVDFLTFFPEGESSRSLSSQERWRTYALIQPVAS